MAVAELAKRQPNIGWVNVLNNLGAKTDSIDVAQPAYYDKLNTAFKIDSYKRLESLSESLFYKQLCK